MKSLFSRAVAQKQKKPLGARIKRGLKVAVTTGILATTAGVVGLGGYAMSSHLANMRALRKAGVPLAKESQYNLSDWCAGYAKDVALQVSKKQYPVGLSAWELPFATKVTYTSDFDRVKLKGGISRPMLEKLVQTRVITKGTLVGCFYADSPHNAPQKPFTHVLVYVGDGKFAHNLHGPELDTIKQLYSRGRLFPVTVMEPK